MATQDLWAYRDTTWETSELTGYSVQAIDGDLGRIDEATNEVGASYLVIDTGPWIFGKRVLLPAGIISRVDASEETVHVNRTKDQIKNAPEFDDSTYKDDTYRGELAGYYGPEGPAYRDWI